MNKELQPALRQPLVSGGVTSRPILFSTEMVRAILEGRKTQTRRLVKPQPNENGVSYMKNAPLDWESIYREQWTPWKWETEEGETMSKNCPYGEIGDFLWVRETYAIAGNTTKWYIYKADLSYGHIEEKWKPSIFMPREACRIEVRITDIRVERLQSISEEDARREGVLNNLSVEYNQWLNYEKGIYQLPSAVESFKSLWSEINGVKSWDENPFVWVIRFEVARSPKHHR